MSVDLEAIYKSVDAQMTSDEKTHIMDEMIAEVKRQFLYIIVNDDGRYCFTLEQAYQWIGNPPNDYKKAKEKFKSRYLFLGEKQNISDSMFSRADCEKDLFKDYFIKKMGKAEEILFSVLGFQTFCMSQNKGFKAKAVKKYFLLLQTEYLKAVREDATAHKKRCTDLEQELAKMKSIQGDRSICELLSDDQTKRIFDTQDKKIFLHNSEMTKIKEHAYHIQCIADEATDQYGIRAHASNVIRKRYLKFIYKFYLVNPLFIKEKMERKKGRVPSKKPTKVKKLTKREQEEADEIKRILSSYSDDSDDSDNGEKAHSEPKEKSATELLVKQFEDYEGDDMDYVHSVEHDGGVYTSEPYADDFKTMQAKSLDEDNCYFFTIAQDKNNNITKDNSNFRYIGTLEFSTRDEVRHAFKRLGDPLLKDPYKIFLRTYSDIKDCADQAITHLAKNGGKMQVVKSKIDSKLEFKTSNEENDEVDDDPYGESELKEYLSRKLNTSSDSENDDDSGKVSKRSAQSKPKTKAESESESESEQYDDAWRWTAKGRDKIQAEYKLEKVKRKKEEDEEEAKRLLQEETNRKKTEAKIAERRAKHMAEKASRERSKK